VDSWRELQKNSYISWVKKYETEKRKRIEIEQKYKALTEAVKANALQDYYSKLKEGAELNGEEWNEERMDIRGQNGNDGSHYGWIDNKEDKFKEQENGGNEEDTDTNNTKH